MFEYKMRFTVLVAVAALWSSSTAPADTWHLGRDRSLKSVSPEGQDKFLLAVAEIKQLVSTGKSRDVRQAWDRLKKEFPEIAGPAFEAFIKAEMFYCRGKFTKAVRQYDKFLKEHRESRLYYVALERQLAIATAYLAGQKRPVLKIFKIRGYASGEKIAEAIVDRAPATRVAKQAAVAVAQSYEARGKFEDAYIQWSIISSRWPSGRTGRDALLGMARCKHAAYKGPNYDWSSLISAKSYYEEFKARYPKQARDIDVDKKLEQIEEQRAYKKFSVGRYYQKTHKAGEGAGQIDPGKLYYDFVIETWPNSTGAKAAKFAVEDEEANNKMQKRRRKKTIKKLEELLLGKDKSREKDSG